MQTLHDGVFEPDALKKLQGIVDDVWAVVSASGATKDDVAKRILAAVNDGVTDPLQLRAAGFGRVNAQKREIAGMTSESKISRSRRLQGV